MITGSKLRIYSDSSLHTLVNEYTITGSTLNADATGLSAGQNYWATVVVTDSVAGTSSESVPYVFYTLPDIFFTGSATVGSSSFTRTTSITSAVVHIQDSGIQVTTDPTWTNRAMSFSGDTATGLEEHTTYYYRPWVRDEFGRTYVNTSAVASVTTNYAVPSVRITETYNPTSTTFGGKVNVKSTIPVTAVSVECVHGGTTITKNLTAQTGEQEFQVTGLTPFTKYACTAKATNAAGQGISQTVRFTTTEAAPTGDVNIEITSANVSGVDNSVRTASVVEYSEDVDIVSHSIYIYDNSEHEGNPVATYNGGKDSVIGTTFAGTDVSGDTTYFVMSRVEWESGEETGTEWSEAVGIETYTIPTIGTITKTRSSFTVNFRISGYSTDTYAAWSTNQESWYRVNVTNPQGGSFTVTGLGCTDTYYVRMRCANTDGEYSDYAYSTVGSLVNDYFYIENLHSGTNEITLSTEGSPNNFEYSFDGGEWHDSDEWGNGNTITLEENGKVYLRTVTGLSVDDANYHSFDALYDWCVGGNITTLVDYGQDTVTSIPPYCLYQMAANSPTLTGSEGIDLSGIDTVEEFGMTGIFENTGLNTAPDMSTITTLATSSLNHAFCNTQIQSVDLSGLNYVGDFAMSNCFENCSSLVSVASESVMEVGEEGMSNCFNGCTSLEKGIDLRECTTVGTSGLEMLYYACSSIYEAVCPNLDSWDIYKTKDWLAGAGSGGTNTLYCPPIEDIPDDNDSGVPSGWVREEY